MALIVITIADNEKGDADLTVHCEPGLNTDPNVPMTSAQVVALTMLNASTQEATIKKDRGLIQLIRKDKQP